VKAGLGVENCACVSLEMNDERARTWRIIMDGSGSTRPVTLPTSEFSFTVNFCSRDHVCHRATSLTESWAYINILRLSEIASISNGR
jgi:hypothetical protein